MKMKKNLLLLALILTLVMGVGCSDSKNKLEVNETKLTLEIAPKIETKSDGSSATTKSYYRAKNVSNGNDFLIPVEDILGFNYKENYTYQIVVLCTQNYQDGLPVGNPWYKVLSVISEIYTPEGPVNPTPTPSEKE